MRSFRLLLMLGFLVGCGTEPSSIPKGNPTNSTGGGSSSPSPVITALDIPIQGVCVEVISGKIWVENDGDRMDIYNNEDCAHGPHPKKALCNNVHIGELNCETGEYRYYIEAEYADMVLYWLAL